MRHGLLALLLFVFFATISLAQSPVIDSLQRIIAQGKTDSVAILARIKLAEEFSRTDMQVAKRWAYKAVYYAKQANRPLQLSAAYSLLTTFNARTNQPDSARYYLDLLKKLATESNIPKIKSNYNSTSGLFYRSQGNYKAALPFMFESLRLSTLDNNKTAMAGQNLNIGNNYNDMGDYGNAITYHLRALKVFEELGNKRGMSFCYTAVGTDFIKLRQYKTALPYVQKSEVIKNELNDKRGKAIDFINTGQIEEGLKQPDKALASYLEALNINRQLKLTSDEAKVDLDIGKLYAGKKDVDNAMTYLNNSKDLFRHLGDSAFVSTVNAEITSLQRDRQQQAEAEKTFIGSLNSSLKMGDKSAEISDYKNLADLYAKNKQFDKALFYSEKYHAETEQSQSRELQLQINELEQRYNLEKKEREISLLKKDRLLYQANLQNQKLYRYIALGLLLMLAIIGGLVIARYRVVQKANRLLEMEKLRNSIARNLHDDIGSTLSSINIMSKVAIKQADGNANVLRDLEKIKDSSFTIMESMSDIVWAINPANDSLDKTILRMRDFAAAILEPAGIGFTFDEEGKIADLKLNVDERKNLYLIFKEAINNVAKYSGATLSTVVLKRTDSMFLMKITDNGSGFDNTKQYTGNGLKNMRARATEMTAEFEISSKAGAGTGISLGIPIT